MHLNQEIHFLIIKGINTDCDLSCTYLESYLYKAGFIVRYSGQSYGREVELHGTEFWLLG